MNLDRRLHHAARDLRAVDIPIPSLRTAPSHHQPRMTALVAGLALLIVLTGASIALLRVGSSTPTQPMAALGADVNSAIRDDPMGVDGVLDPHEEIAIIERLSAESSTVSVVPSRPALRGVI